MDEADAVLVTKKWWSRSHATKPSLNSVVSAIDDAGFQGQRRERNDGTCWKPASGRKKGLPLTELLGYQKKTLYCSACIAAIWFVIERFGKQIFLCTIFACGSGYETTGKAWHCGSGYEKTGKAWHEA